MQKSEYKIKFGDRIITGFFTSSFDANKWLMAEFGRQILTTKTIIQKIR